MKQKMPWLPFATRLFGSAKETELRIRNIFQWKKKRPPVILFLAAILLVAGCGSLVNFDNEADPGPAQSQISMDVQEGQDAGPTLTMDCLSEIGKTFDLIREENPGIEYQTIDIPDASGQCLGQAQGQFLYYFFGTQDVLLLTDLSEEYGQQLRCAGIVSTVGEVYPETTDELPLEQFFSDHQISEYTYDLEDGPSKGWIEFSCDDYLVWINTNDSGASSDDSAKAATMKRSYTVIIIDEEIANDNDSIQYKYRNDYLEAEHTPSSAAPDKTDANQAKEDQMAMQPPEELTAAEACKAVLQGNMEFRDRLSGGNFDISRVQEVITPDNSVTLEPTYFAVVDLDGDGTEEVILAVAIVGVGVSNYLVLRWQDGIVYGYPFAEREFSDLKTDGTFWNTGGASDIGICRVTFDKDTKSIDRFSFTWERHTEDGDGISYFVDHQETTQEEWERVLSQWNEIPYAEWYEFTDANIETVLS